MGCKFTDADFDRLIVPEPNTGCHLWLGAGDRYGVFGYDVFHDGSRRIRHAHRYSYQRANGPIPDGLYVCHWCDTPMCVNEDHLFLGTPLANMQDMIAKGRSRAGVVAAAKTHCKRGHEFTDENTRYGINKNGRQKRCCRKCAIIAQRRFHGRPSVSVN